jgi:uncharacterized protein (TIGR02246 family)
MKTPKIRLLGTLLGLAINFAVPTFAQEKDEVAPQVRQQLEAIDKKFDEAINNHDAAAVAALFTQDAVEVTPLGVLSGRRAIDKYYANVIEQHHLTDQVNRLDHVYTFGSDLCAIGGYSVKTDGYPAGGHRASVYTRDGDTWKFRVMVVKY